MPAARIQPQGRIRINRANPLARGLQFAYVPGGGPTDATGKRQRLTEPAPQAYPNGKITPPLNGATFPTYGYIDSPNTGGFSVAVLGIFDPLPGNGTSDQREPLLSIGNWKFSNRNGNSGYTSYGVADYDITCPLPPSGFAGVSVTFGASARFFVGGSFAASIAVGAPNAATNAQIAVGTRSGGSDIVGRSQVSLALYWDRILTDAEHASIASNPWQLFEDRPALLSAPVASAGSGATASPPGVSASSAVGGATVTGQANTAPAGVSAASSIGSATVSGQGKVTPAGVSAASAVGTATASGAASSTAQPAGASAAASVGASVATGQANAAPSGVSASAAAGSATALGTANAAPLGVSSAIYVGAAYAYGPFDLASYPKLYATTLMRLDAVNRQGGTMSATLARQSAIRATEADNSLMRAQPINLTSAMRSDPINRTAGLL